MGVGREIDCLRRDGGEGRRGTYMNEQECLLT